MAKKNFRKKFLSKINFIEKKTLLKKFIKTFIWTCLFTARNKLKSRRFYVNATSFIFYASMRFVLCWSELTYDDIEFAFVCLHDSLNIYTVTIHSKNVSSKGRWSDHVLANWEGVRWNHGTNLIRLRIFFTELSFALEGS